MATARELARWIVESFDGTQREKLEKAIIRVLHDHGYGRFQAAEEASEEKCRQVLVVLASMKSEELPFDFSDFDNHRLIGKQVPRLGDTPETTKVRQRLALIPEMRKAIIDCGWATFEKICARLMMLSGAEEAFATGSNNDGGIDIYGRIPIRMADPTIPPKLLNTVLIDKRLLFLGQCKCQQLRNQIGRPDLHRFSGAIADCLKKYEGNIHPPSNRVPEDYYRTQETCLQVFFATSDYSPEAASEAESSDIILIDGQRIAQFLLHYGVGIVKTAGDTENISMVELASWAQIPSTNGD